jgi:hypothetical protein
MIVVGVDVHKQSLTAVAVDEAGRALAELTAGSGRELLAWAESLESDRLWALEDCRQLTRALERSLLGAGERLVRVSTVRRERPRRIRWVLLQAHGLEQCASG